MPLDSNWKTPSVSPRASISKVGSSSSGRPERSPRSTPADSRMSRIASSMTSRLRRPRKSILSSPSASTSPIGYWVTSSESAPFCCSGRYSTQRPVADHDAGGVDPVLRGPGPPAGGPCRRRARTTLVLVVGRSQLLAGLHALVEADLDAFRDELRDAVDGAVGQAQHAADVAHRGLRGELAEGDDLRHPLAAVLLDHVLHDALAAVHREVDVDVRHRLAARVEEALEEQVVADRVDVGDAERSTPPASPPPSRGPGPTPTPSRLAKATKSQTIRK